jgi:hypothetical protein
LIPHYSLSINLLVFGNYPQPIIIYKNISKFIYGDINKIVLSGGDELLSEKIISEIITKRESFEIANRDRKNDSERIDAEKIVIKDITEMDNKELIKFLNQSVSENFEKRALILRNRSKHISHQAKKLNYTALPTAKRLRPILPVIFYLFSKEKGLFSNYEKISQSNFLLRYLSSEALRDFFNSIDSLNNLDMLLNKFNDKSVKIGQLTCPDFWYDYLKDINKLSLQETNSQPWTMEVKEINDNSTHPFQFLRRENNKLKIIFDGKDIALRNEDLLGLHYLRLIIKYGKDGMSYQEIENNYRDYIVEAKEKSQLETTDMMDGDEEDKTSILQPVESFVGYEYIDKTTIKILKEKIERLKEKKEIFESELNIDEAKSIDMELDKLYKYLDISLNIKGESRTTNTEIEKSKRRVKKAINIALNQIKIENLKFYSYLVKSVILDKGKDKYFYISDPKIDWVLEQ